MAASRGDNRAYFERGQAEAILSMYTVLYMAAIRTQIYLTPELRAKLDDAVRRQDKSLAQIVREALDAYLRSEAPDREATLTSTFGSMPDLSIPSRAEWERG